MAPEASASTAIDTPSPALPCPDLDGVRTQLRDSGFCFLPASLSARLCASPDAIKSTTASWPSPEAWSRFAASWDGMPLDGHMADHGRYRRRRHAVLALTAGQLSVLPHQPHWQSLQYNPLNGGVARWFEAIAADTLADPVLRRLLDFGARALLPADARARWLLELHQFRIEARPDHPGLPTPEGSHRDGVDYVMVVLVRRENIRRGCTTIHTPAAEPLGEFTLSQPLDMALVDDHRVFHGVTPVEPVDPTEPAWRDVLVVTYKRA